MKKLSRLRKQLKVIKYIILLISSIILIYISKSIIIKKQIENNTSSEFIEINNTDIKNKPELQINKLMFEGKTKDLSTYQIFSDIINRTDTDKYKLSVVNGIYHFDNDKVNIAAKDGIYDQASNAIILQNKVQVNYKDIKVLSEEMKINVHNKHIQSELPINFIYKNSNIKADSLEVKDSNTVFLKGNVETILNISDF